MEFLVAFSAAFLATLLVGALSRLVASLFASTPTARVAGFSVAIGFVLARYSFAGSPDIEMAAPIAAATGAVVALVVLWLWLLRPLGAAESSARTRPPSRVATVRSRTQKSVLRGHRRQEDRGRAME